MQIILFRKNVETKQEQTATQETGVALTDLVLPLSAPDFIPPSCSSVCTPHLNPRFQVWETKPNDPWNIKQDPTKHCELSLASSQNVAEPQSITWFWVKTTLNHHFFFYGFDLKTGFHAKLALVSEEFLGRVQARLQLVWTLRHWQPQSACVEAISSHSALQTLPRFCTILITWSLRWLKIIRCIDKKYSQSVHLFVLSFYKNGEENFWKAMNQKEWGESKDLSMYGGNEEIRRNS